MLKNFEIYHSKDSTKEFVRNFQHFLCKTNPIFARFSPKTTIPPKTNPILSFVAGSLVALSKKDGEVGQTQLERSASPELVEGIKPNFLSLLVFYLGYLCCLSALRYPLYTVSFELNFMANKL